MVVGRGELAAQSARKSEVLNVRGFNLGPLGTRLTFDPDPRARALLKPVLTAAMLDGMDDRIIFRESPGVNVAEAVFEAPGQATRRRFILYNPTHIQELAARSDRYWVVVGILAHEV